MAVKVGISGAAGRMGSLVVDAVVRTEDLEPAWLFDPHHDGASVAGLSVTGDRDSLDEVDVVVEFTRPDVVLENLAEWRRRGAHAVVGTSGFDAARVAEVRTMWGDGPGNCLIVPNFSIGAVLMMRFAEKAAHYLSAAEIIEMHHAGKIDSPSGTAQSTAERMSLARESTPTSSDADPARGLSVGGTQIHSVRLPGLLAHQAVMFGSDGEVLTIRHDTTDRKSFMTGVLVAIRGVGALAPVSVGLDQLLA